jgi:SAM-dependent methyltransferase
MKFKEHDFAHQLLDSLTGIEIGGAAHNPFNLPNCKNVDYTDDMNTMFKQGEFILCGEKLHVDIVAEGDDLPLEDNSVDYVISSHVLEHFFDPIKAVKEWLRVVRPSGYVFIIVPKQNAIPTETRPCTQLQELLDRHEGRMKPEEVVMEGGHQISTVSGLPMGDRGHWSVWNLENFLPICEHYGWNVVYTEETDLKVGNGFTVVIQK